MKIMKTSVEQQYGYMLEERIQQISLLSKNIFSPSYYGLHSGAKIKASCIKCASPSCIQYDSISENELPLKSMPSTTDYSVCPSGCIHLSNSLQFEIVISSEDCINCGLCVSACKYGALYLGESFVVINNDSKFLKTSNALDENVLLTQNKLTELPRQLSLSGITIEHLINVTEKIKAESRQSNGYENIVVRNMLLQCGLKAVLRAIGNNDIRFDLIAKLEDNYYMVGEIALRENDTLDRPRKILDDIAVLHNRYKIPIDKIIPVIFISSFPNKRSDYYEIIQDINCELGIRIRTVPLAILLLLVYSDKKISLNDLIHSFYISKSNYSILDTISDELKELIMSFTDGEISLFQAVK